MTKCPEAMNVSQQIKELFKMLSPIEQQGLLSELLSSNTNGQLKESIVTTCPYSHDVRIVKNGKFKGYQRYKCKSCNRNFSPHSGTAYQGIKKLDTFTNIEPLYKKFIKEQSRRTYRCSTKRHWTSQQKEAIIV